MRSCEMSSEIREGHARWDFLKHDCMGPMLNGGFKVIVRVLQNDISNHHHSISLLSGTLCVVITRIRSFLATSLAELVKSLMKYQYTCFYRKKRSRRWHHLAVAGRTSVAIPPSPGPIFDQALAVAVPWLAHVM